MRGPEDKRVYDSSPPVSGSIEEIAEGLRAHAREGITHVMIWLNATDEKFRVSILLPYTGATAALRATA